MKKFAKAVEDDDLGRLLDLIASVQPPLNRREEQKYLDIQFKREMQREGDMRLLKRVGDWCFQGAMLGTNRKGISIHSYSGGTPIGARDRALENPEKYWRSQDCWSQSTTCEARGCGKDLSGFGAWLHHCRHCFRSICSEHSYHYNGRHTPIKLPGKYCYGDTKACDRFMRC